ncbi:MAG: reductive dehalogenase domain-containing protein [Nitratireductor sp.]
MNNPWPSNRDDGEEEEALVAGLNARFAAADKAAGIEVQPGFARFVQRNDVFTRAFWDDRVKSTDATGFFESYRMKAAPRRGEGFSQRDFALRNAAWSVSDMVTARGEKDGRREGFQSPVTLDTLVAEERLSVDDPAAMSAEVKRIARFFGADLVAITDHDERWMYKSRVDTRDFSEADNRLPEGITHVIILGHSMDRELVDTYPSALAGASTGREYSHEAAIVIQLASYIRNLGHEAVPSMNDTGLVIPLAVKAGLGDYGRNQLVITPQYGPRLRFSKIFTSLPLLADEPKRHGIADYCAICTKCADQCPPKALPFGEPDAKQLNPSSIAGVRKWTADCEKCFGYWARIKSDCAICMRVCPFNRDFSRPLNRLWRRLATSRFRRLALWWENRFPSGARLRPRDWWAGKHP